MNLGFNLFLVLAGLLVINAVREFKSARGQNPKKSSIANGVVSLLAATGAVAAGFYLFKF